MPLTTAYCPECGKQIDSFSVGCNEYGAKFEDDDISLSETSKEPSKDHSKRDQALIPKKSRKILIFLAATLMLVLLSGAVILNKLNYHSTSFEETGHCTPTPRFVCVSPLTDLSNVLTSAKIIHTKTGSYGKGSSKKMALELEVATPSVAFASESSVPVNFPTRPNVGVKVVSSNVMMIYARDHHGGCWGISSNTSPYRLDIFPSGVHYWWSTVKNSKTACDEITLTTRPIYRTDSFNGVRLRLKP